MGIRAMLFDLDGTLWRTSASLDLQLVQEIQQRRLHTRLDAWSVPHKCLDVALRKFWEELNTLETVPDPSLRERAYSVLLSDVLGRHGIRLAGQQAQVLWVDLYVPHPSFPKELYEDTLATLSLLRRRGFKIGLVSNRPWAGHVFRPEFEEFRMSHYFDVVVSSTDVGFRKPHPLTFETALRALAVPAAQALMVGDSLANDVVGAERCGIKAVWKTSADEPLAETSGRTIINSLSDLTRTGLL